MTWNYRIVKKLNGTFGIYAVYYEKKKINSMSEMSVVLEDTELLALIGEHQLIKHAFKRPVLVETITKKGKWKLK
jgi:ABC-type antimicrobial peptide transport system ATPase subunit